MKNQCQGYAVRPSNEKTAWHCTHVQTISRTAPHLACTATHRHAPPCITFSKILRFILDRMKEGIMTGKRCTVNWVITLLKAASSLQCSPLIWIAFFLLLQMSSVGVKTSDTEESYQSQVE